MFSEPAKTEKAHSISKSKSIFVVSCMKQQFGVFFLHWKNIFDPLLYTLVKLTKEGGQKDVTPLRLHTFKQICLT